MNDPKLIRKKMVLVIDFKSYQEEWDDFSDLLEKMYALAYITKINIE